MNFHLGHLIFRCELLVVGRVFSTRIFGMKYMSATVDRSVFFFQMPVNSRHFFNCKALLSYREQRGATGIFMDFHRFSWIFNSPPVTGPTDQKHISCPLSTGLIPKKVCLSLFCFSKFDAQQIMKTKLTLDFFEIKLTTR